MSTANYTALIAQLVEVRNAKNLSQRALAELMGINQPEIARWEKHARPPSLGSLLMWAHTLGCELSILTKEGMRT